MSEQLLQHKFLIIMGRILEDCQLTNRREVGILISPNCLWCDDGAESNNQKPTQTLLLSEHIHQIFTILFLSVCGAC